MTDSDARDRLIVALDTNAEGARRLVSALSGSVRWLKVGMTLFYEAGPSFVEELRSQGFSVFLDLKLHDIPHQVRGAATSVSRLGVQMLTVHAAGGPDMIAAAVEGAETGASAVGLARPAVIAVTVLTSMNDHGLVQVGVDRPSRDQVPLLGKVAASAGADGVVCSPHEAARMRALLGADALVVTPGVRPGWAEAGDQTRISAPSDALAAGASHLVVGRPITAAADPAEAAVRILEEMESAL